MPCFAPCSVVMRTTQVGVHKPQWCCEGTLIRRKRILALILDWHEPMVA